MFGVKFSSSTSSSNWPPELAASTVSPPNSCYPSNANRKLQHYRPESLIGITLIKSLADVSRQLDREKPLLRSPILKNCTALLAILPAAHTGPADPDSTAPSQERSHRAGQAARTPFRAPAFVRLSQGKWKAIGNNNKPRGHGSIGKLLQFSCRITAIQ
jgi:hypothetical protein